MCTLISVVKCTIDNLFFQMNGKSDICHRNSCLVAV